MSQLSPPLEATAAESSSGELGAHWDGRGVHFSVYAGEATAVELCLFDHPAQGRESARHSLRRREDGIWQVYLPGHGPGQLYGYRVHGPYQPRFGQRHNPAKLLLDPYARSVAGEVVWSDELYGYQPQEPQRPSSRDSSPFMAKAMVVDPSFAWGDDRPPAHPWSETLIYECHVKGMTQLHSLIPRTLRGTYLGLAQEPVLEHLLSLGVTAVELLPVQHSLTEHRLHRMGLANYWGYNTLAFFAPDRRFTSLDDPVREFKTMVRRLHREGLEVILDIALNHTAEGDHRGPTLSLKGFDNLAYYRLQDGHPQRYLNYSGCGNTLDIRKPRALQLVLDCLRYWVREMHVDGFRFDLAPVLARDPAVFNPHAPLFQEIQRDPLLSSVKWIAEPWDIGPEGYRLGGFPSPFREWNDRWRDTVRSFWRGDAGRVPELASRLAGSRDIFHRRPNADIHFVACHDGFTTRDVVSYERKHNQANGEGNRDGHGHNLSRNWGHEGATDDPVIQSLRRKLHRSLLTTALFSQGVPMLFHGDEMGHSQRGNNNAYCQDNPTSWLDWKLRREEAPLLAFVRRASRLRRSLGWAWRPQGGDLPAPHWFHPSGRAMGDEEWNDGELRSLGMCLREPGGTGALLLLLHAGDQGLRFQLPQISAGWHLALDSAAPELELGTAPPRQTESFLESHSVQCLVGTVEI
ncbi:MAG: glycogen debranching protein GlgX [Acidobacteriota bacterium]|nr:glycogen debranching protein GlgX [Acidobacteriota bacterium]